MNIVIACDKMKGTFSSKQFGEMVERAFKSKFKDCNTKVIQVSDGGDGFIESLRWHNNFSRWEFLSYNAAHRKIQSKYLYNIYNSTAIIESAITLSLSKLAKNEKQILQNNSFGLGYDINRVINVRHPKKIVVGIGGTSTNDLFLGAANALGFKFLNKHKEEINPIPENFLQIEHIISPTENFDTPFIAAVDVKNPLLGLQGATNIFAPQKGATKNDVDFLEKAFEHLSLVIKNSFGVDITTIESGGAGGGICAGMVAFLNAKIVSGADFILDNIDFDNIIKDADLVVTGEGSFDKQSIMGKITGNIINRCQKQNKKVLIISGLYDNTPLPSNCKNIALFNKGIDIKSASEQTEARIMDIITLS